MAVRSRARSWAAWAGALPRSFTGRPRHIIEPVCASVSWA